MSTFLQFVAVTVLGLVAAWLLRHWMGLFDSSNVAIVFWVSLCLAYGFIYDRRQKRRRLRDMPGSPRRD